MPRATRLLSGWSAGEFSPRLQTRADLQQFPRSLKECTNFIVTPEGALLRRPPTRRLGTTRFPTGNVVLLEFVPSSTVSYVIEFGNLYARIWSLDGLVPNDTSPITLTTPYTAEQVRQLQTAQDADVLYVVHPDYLPHKLRRLTVAPTFDFVPVTFLDGRAPLDTMNTSATTITLSGTYPTLTATASAPTFISSDVGRAIYVRDPGTKRGVYGTITTFTSSTVVSVTGTFRAGDTAGLPGAVTSWALGLFSSNNGCRAVAFHEGRLWYGGFKVAPDVLVGSVSNSFDNFETVSPDPAANDAANSDKAITRRANSGSVEEIQWLLSGADVLFVGTSGAEFVVRPGVTGFLTPTEAAVRRTTGRGSQSAVRPVRVDSTAFFVQRGGTKLRQVKYDLERDGFVTQDASVLCSHLTTAGIRRLAYQQAPWSVLWMTDTQDRLFGITLEGEQAVVGAHRHALGGGYEGRNARVRDIVSIPDYRGSATSDVLFMIVQRTVNGVVERTVEVLESVGDFSRADLSKEDRIYSLEKTAFVDSYTRLSPIYQIASGEFVSGNLRFTVESTSAVPALSEEVVLRGLVWRDGQEVISRTILNRQTVVVTAVGATWFEVGNPETALPHTPTTLGLPATAQLALLNPELPPVAARRVVSASFPATVPGDNYVIVADGRYETSGALSYPASFVVGGFRASASFETQPVFLQAGVPADFGEPALITRATFWLWGGLGAQVRVGEAPPETVVLAFGDNPMDALPPTPLYEPVVVDVQSDPTGQATLRFDVSGPTLCEVTGLTFVQRTLPR